MGISIWLEFNGAVFDDDNHNITHNVADMWRAAGCYDALYNSEGRLARDVIPTLCEAFCKMHRDPATYEAMNPSNGWGSYRVAMEFLSGLIQSFRRIPDGVIRVSK